MNTRRMTTSISHTTKTIEVIKTLVQAAKGLGHAGIKSASAGDAGECGGRSLVLGV